MVSILDSLHRVSFQFNKNDSAAMWIYRIVYKNWELWFLFLRPQITIQLYLLG